MGLKAFITACIAIGMHSSVCTGGFFAITAAIADQAAYQNDDTGPMSYGAIGYLSCKSTVAEKGVRADEEPGCENAATCLTRISAATKNVLFVPVQHVADALILSEPELPEFEYFASANALARDGPLYENAIEFVRHTQKLE